MFLNTPTTTKASLNEFEALAAELKRFGLEIDALLPALVKGRRDYMRTRSAADKAENLRLEKVANELSDQHARLYEHLKQLSGLPEEILEAIDRPHLPDDGVDRRPRTSLVREKVETTGLVDDHIANALDTVRRIVPKGWLEHFPLSVQHTRRCGSSWRIRLAGRHRVGVRCGTRGPRPIAQQLFGARL